MIAGAGIAGVSCARELRTQGYEARVVLIDAAAAVPYARPPLSKAILSSVDEPESPLLRPEAEYGNLGIELVLGCEVTAIDTEAAVVKAGGDEFRYGSLVLATGRRARRLAVEGATLSGVLSLRSFDDAVGIRRRLRAATKILVVGGGFIGAEVASTARELGVDVTVVELSSEPLARVLPTELGALCHELMVDAGVEVRTKTSVLRLEGDGSVERAHLTDGARVDTQLVVVGVGTVPNVPPIDGCVATGPGLLVDSSLRLPHPGVFAIGDIAVAPSARGAVCLEQWTNAVEHGRHVARCIARREQTPYRGCSYAWSQQFGHVLQLAGHLVDADQIVMTQRGVGSLYLARAGNQLAGAFGIDAARDVLRARALIQRQATWQSALEVLAVGANAVEAAA